MRAADLLLGLAFILLAAVPWALGAFAAWQVGLFLLYGIVGQGIALCWGRIGILPLGQSLFFGLGAYIGGAALIRFEADPLMLIPGLLAALILPALLAFVTGLLVFRRQSGSGPWFSLITLALSMLATQMALGLEGLTGGFNGLSGIPPIPGTDPFGNFYWLILAALVLTTLVLRHLYKSPIGTVWRAIAQNEDRLALLGFDTALIKAFGYAVSAAFAGLAGVLFAAQQGIVTPQAVGYVLAGELLIWTAVGGRASLLGPVAGALLIGLMTAELRDTFAFWEILVAAVFLVVVLFLPQGLAGLVDPLLSRFARPAPPPRDRLLPLTRPEGPLDLEIEDLRVTMGGVDILRGLSLRVMKPGLHCVIGPNGAGKTSAFNALTGRLPVRSGRIRWQGQAMTGTAAFRVARLGIARKMQVPAIFPDLTVGQHLDIAFWAGRAGPAALLGRGGVGWSNAILQRLHDSYPFLQDEAQKAGALSLGHRQVLEFALAILGAPRLVLLDEPCAGLSTAETAILSDTLRRVADEFGISALIIEHDMSVVERLSDHVYVLHQGQLLAEGALDAIRGNPAVQAVYAGGSK